MSKKDMDRRKKFILELMGDPIYQPMRLREISSLLRLSKEEKRELYDVLDELCREGKVSVDSKGRYEKVKGKWKKKKDDRYYDDRREEYGSEYGRNKKEAESNNTSNTEKLTGFNYKEDYANTTTGNIYGIYDFDNNLPEIVAISHKNSEKLKEETYKEMLNESENAKKSTKYLTLYADSNNVYGDALNETSDKTTNKYWNR